jgi:hypothetical protein
MAMTKTDDTCEKQRWAPKKRVKKGKSLKKGKSPPPPCNKCDACLTNKLNKERYEKWKEGKALTRAAQCMVVDQVKEGGEEMKGEDGDMGTERLLFLAVQSKGLVVGVAAGLRDMEVQPGPMYVWGPGQKGAIRERDLEVHLEGPMHMGGVRVKLHQPGLYLGGGDQKMKRQDIIDLTQE